jgi:hypothetical protein
VASGARSHVPGSCPTQPSPLGFNEHSQPMTGAFTPSSPTDSMYRTMQRPLGIFVLRCGFIQSSAIFMVSWIILVISLGSADPLQKPSPAMPRLRLRMRPRRGSPWHPRRPSTPSSPPGSAVPARDNWAMVDTLWNQTQPFRSVKHSISPPPSRTSHPSHISPERPASLPREHYVILQDLVFELREGVSDLQFRVQQMEGRLSILLQLLATPSPVAPEHSSEASETPSDSESSQQTASTTETPESERKEGHPNATTPLAQTATCANMEGASDNASSAMATAAKGSSLQVPDANNRSAMDMQWTGGTPVAEEPWIGTLPEYVPDCTVFIPYFNSGGSHGS